MLVVSVCRIPVSVFILVSAGTGDIELSVLSESAEEPLPDPDPQAAKKQTTTAVARVKSLVFITVNFRPQQYIKWCQPQDSFSNSSSFSSLILSASGDDVFSVCINASEEPKCVPAVELGKGSLSPASLDDSIDACSGERGV